MKESSRSSAMLFAFIIVVLGVGFSIGLMIRPGAWYEAPVKPSFTPPNWLFAPAWTFVYILIAIAGWRTVSNDGIWSPAFRLWIAQMILNWSWTPIFFGLHQIRFGLMIIAALPLVVIAFIILSRDWMARWCFVPYALWLCYATGLNAAILVLN